MITKTDFMKYVECPMYFWLSKHRPELLDEVTPAAERIFEMGRQVDELAKKLFAGGVEIEGYGQHGFGNTQKAMESGATIMFQPTFLAGNISSRADILKKNEDGGWDIYEVKMSTKVQKDYIFDTGFQKICYQNAGIKIGQVTLVHINKDYVRQGDIEPEKLFVFQDITRDVDLAMAEITDEIDRAIKIMEWQQEPDVRLINLCTNPKGCEYIECYCKGIEIYSVVEKINPNHLSFLIERKILDAKKVPQKILDAIGYEPEAEFTEINAPAIKKEFEKLQYPLYFFDYETYSSAIPLFDGTKPYQQIPFQYSLHIKEDAKAKVVHREFLMLEYENPIPKLLENLKKDLGPTGSVIVWFAFFEASRNQEMAQAEPEYAEFLKSVNDRMFDLMLIFKFKNKMYIKSEFQKLASLKVVLPVLCPKLSYKSLAIQEGGTASASWPILTSDATDKKAKQKLKKDMLAYCERDTQAMVSILNRVCKDIKIKL